MSISNISIRSVTLPSDKVLESTSYQVSSNGLFEDDDIIIDIANDTENLYSKSFELDYTSFSVYYARVKLNFSDGSYYGWTKPIMLTKDGDGYSYNNTIIVTPELTIDSDIDNCELGSFKIFGGKFRIFDGNSTHKYTDWKISDINGNLKFQSLKDRNNLEMIRVPHDTLDPNNIYIIEADYVSSDNNKSNTGKLFIKTAGVSKDEVEVGYDDKIRDVTYDRDLMIAYDNLLQQYVNHLALERS